jgi:ABC-type antimicrobial peptide transport system permease subunit
VGATLALGFRIVLAGLAVGTVAALATSRSLSSMLYRVDPHDPGMVAAAAAIVVVAAFAACLGPAMAAARVDPATLLREE